MLGGGKATKAESVLAREIGGHCPKYQQKQRLISNFNSYSREERRWEASVDECIN